MNTEIILNTIINRARGVLDVINNWFVRIPSYSKASDYWWNHVKTNYNSRGARGCIARIKAIRSHTVAYWAGKPITTSLIPSLAIRKNGLPKVGPLTDIIANATIWEKRLILAMFSISRALPVKPLTPNLDTIIKPSTSQGFENIKKEVRRVIDFLDLRMDFSPRPDAGAAHVTTKSGPNGIALLSAVRDAKALPYNLYMAIGVVGGEHLHRAMAHVSDFEPSGFETIFSKKPRTKSLVSKLSIVSQPEGKDRIIAILDYWSQSSLKPLHDRIFSILKKIPGDCTFNQGSPRMYLKTGPYYSLDLTAATDRFPVKFQEFVLSIAIDPEYSKAWQTLCIDREFYVPWTDTKIKYLSGQPMGAYSSWAVFALCHHIIVRVAAIKAGKGPGFSNYALLGDDIVIGGKDVAEQYIQLINQLGVEINFSKTLISDSSFEFAKRIYIDGEEITGLSLNSFLSSNRYYLLINEISSMLSRWSLKPYEADPGLVKDLFSGLGLPQRLWSKAVKLLYLPRKEDTQEERQEKASLLANIVFPNEFSCNSRFGQQWELLTAALAECKARVMEDGLLAARSKANDMIKSITNNAKNCYKGVDFQTALYNLPVVEVSRNQYKQLEEDIMKLRNPKEVTPDKLIFNQVVFLGFDATRLLTTRSHEIILSSNATLINRLTLWGKKYSDLRKKFLYSDIDENSQRAMARELFRTNVIGAVMPGFPILSGHRSPHGRVNPSLDNN